MSIDFVQRYVRALASGNVEQIARWYHPDARSYGPLAWPEAGAGAIAASLARSAARLDGLQIELHDTFANQTGDRVALRLVRRWSRGAARRSGKRPESIAERFVDDFGRNDPGSLLALYGETFTLYSPIAWGLPGRDPLAPFVQQFHQGFPGLRLALLDQFSSADGTRVAFRFGMRWHNTGTFFGHPPTGDRGTHAEFHPLRLADGQIVEQIVTDISYGIPRYELTVWHRQYPADTEDPAPKLGAGRTT